MNVMPNKSHLSKALTALAGLVLVWIVWTLYVRGNLLLGATILFAGVAILYVYGTRATLAWRYLFPGVAAMFLFIAFPLFYTVQIGFTNYSSSNLLSEESARSYLLDQSEFDERSLYGFSLHRVDSALHVVLTASDKARRMISPALLEIPAHPPIPMALLDSDRPLGSVLTLPDVIKERGRLLALQLAMPDGSTLSYAGLREFGVKRPLWQPNPDGSLTELATQQAYRANLDTGFFENAAGDRLQPGFKVGIGLKNYTRMFLDPDMRGPFISIFVWTVIFAGLTVVFSTMLGMTLAVLLNWEALRFRGLYRTLLFLPYAVPGFISILVFKGLFNQNFGEINAILNALFSIKPAWFADPTLARVMILIVNTWLGYPYIMVLCAGLIKSIPADLYEASAIAGAKPLTNFWRITVPLIAKPMTPLLISAFAFNFNNFVLISLLTDGRPDYLNTKLPAGTTDILVSYTYRIAFTDAGANFGLAAAISTVIFMLVAVLSIVNLRLTQRNDKR